VELEKIIVGWENVGKKCLFIKKITQKTFVG
jgi:hypothetical protein